MKRSKLNEMTPAELSTKLQDNLVSLQNLRFQKALQQLEDPTQIRVVRREIAQIRTVLKEIDLGVRTSEGDK